jgi:DNA-binding CsgD family transcriptional regulator
MTDAEMLTPRQLEVCVIVTEAERMVGHITDKAIAREMGISPRTVRVLMQKAAERLRVADPGIPDVSPRRVIIAYAKRRVYQLAEVKAAELTRAMRAA